MEGRGGATWSITVGDPPGLEGREEEGRFVPQSLVAEELLRRSSAPRGLWLVSAGRGGQDCWQLRHQVSGCASSFFSMDGQFDLKGELSPKPQVGGAGRRRWVFSLLTLEDRAAECQGGSQWSPRP